jgi:hypothetical protein
MNKLIPGEAPRGPRPPRGPLANEPRVPMVRTPEAARGGAQSALIALEDVALARAQGWVEAE